MGHVTSSLNGGTPGLPANVIKEARSNLSNLSTILLGSIREHWHKIVSLLPISRKSLYDALVLFMINYLQKKKSSH